VSPYWHSSFSLYSSKTLQERQIKMLWLPTCNHRFKVKSYCHTLQIDESSLYPWKSVWKVKAPPCIAFFTWAVVLGKILTIDNFQRQGLTLVNWCCLCKKSEETINHPLIHCEFTSEIFHFILILFGVWWVISNNIVELLQCWKTQGQGQSKEAIRKVIPLYLYRVFVEKEIDVFSRTANLLCFN
jgi:hypothetical protein